MPFRSKAQQGFLEANPEKVGGKKKLAEWEQSTDYSNLPESLAQENKSPRKKKFSFAPQKTRAGYTQDQKVA